MHIPDNYLSPETCAVMGAATLPVLALAAKKLKYELTPAKMPMLGIGAAFSFLIMMFNIPLPGGTTGHAVGGTLIAVLLGPFSACLSLTAALLIQALFFGDGGILALGANCFNMAIVLPFSGYFIYYSIKKIVKSDKVEYFAVALGSYAGLNFAALFAAIEFGIQPMLFQSASGQALYSPYSLNVSVPAMTIPHILVAGFVEVIFTLSIYLFIKKVSPGTIYEGSKTRMNAIYGLLVALICLAPLGLLAAGTAWGEWGADEIANTVSNGLRLGYTPQSMKTGFIFSSMLPDYTLKGLPDFAAYVVSAVAGTSVCIIIFKLFSGLMRKKKEISDVGENRT